MDIEQIRKFGIVKTRDLVQLYYGARMVVTVRESSPVIVANVSFQLLPQDPRRIAYELNFANGLGGFDQFMIGSPQGFGSGNQQFYAVPGGDTLIIKRNFLTDLEAVCIELVCLCQTNTMVVSTRETFLTPPPVDETLDG